MSKEKKTVSVSLEMDLVERVQKKADQEHRSLSAQIAFFCANAVARKGTDS